MPEHIAEDMPGRMPEDMPDRIPEDMPDKMPKDMSDRMPEDLPVTRITRSKVFFPPEGELKNLFPQSNLLGLPWFTICHLLSLIVALSAEKDKSTTWPQRQRSTGQLGRSWLLMEVAAFGNHRNLLSLSFTPLVY